MTSSKHYTRDDLDGAIQAACVKMLDPRAEVRQGWEKLRATLCELEHVDPGPMSDDLLIPLLLHERDGVSEDGGAAPDVVLEYRPEGEEEYSAFEEFTVLEGDVPEYDEDVPVLAVREASGEISATLPLDLLPFLAEVRLRDAGGSYRLSLPLPNSYPPPNFLSSSGQGLFLGPRSGSGADSEDELEPARAKVPADTARALLARRAK